jgi:hypothetical protein
VERVTFFSPETGFAVLRAQVRGQRDPLTVLGSLPSMSAGEWLTADGWWVRDKEHGLQFKAKILKTIPPTTSRVTALLLWWPILKLLAHRFSYIAPDTRYSWNGKHFGRFPLSAPIRTGKCVHLNPTRSHQP